MKILNQILKSVCVAFSLYSKIPMPRFNWNSSDMKYHFVFFPFVGVFIGALEFFWKILQEKFDFGAPLYLCVAVSIPLLVTGGIHLDGFMDTQDALSSYGSKQKKLEILEDPHLGAFSVIKTAVYFLLILGFGSEIKSFSAILCVCFSFVFSRIFSALGVLFLKKAKSSGMAKTESENSSKKIVGSILAFEFLFFSVLMIFLLHKTGGMRADFLSIFVFLSLALSCAICFFTAKKNFGGITGDIAGFFVCITELFCVILISICAIFGE